VTVTFRDLWLRRYRAGLRNRFQIMHNINRAAWGAYLIEWREIDLGGLWQGVRSETAQSTFRLPKRSESPKQPLT